MAIHEQLQSMLGADYVVEREIGRGGMATVYLARDLRHGRRVAIKVLRPELSLGVAADRFKIEIMIAAALAHPNIVPVFDSGGGPEHLFYVMPYIEGESLRVLLDREHHLSLDRALAIARDVGDALAYAHARNIVHRDIKPENILLVEGRAMVSDFGIARAVEVAGTHRLTMTGTAVGTPLYMSPEQATGERAIDGRSDLYSLAAVLYEMLSGAPPHVADTPQGLLVRKLTEPAPRVRTTYADLPAYVDDAITRALTADREERTPTVAAFLNALRGPRVSAALRRVRSERRWVTGVAAAAVVLAVGALGLWRHGALSRAGPPSNRLGVEVFPFRATVSEGAELAEAIPDLLAAALDGTPGIAVVDPWSAWRPLRADPRTRARSPDLAEADTLARGVRAESFILGSITQIQHDVELTVRIYRRGSASPVRTLSVTGTADSVFELVRSLAVDAIPILSAAGNAGAPLRGEQSLTRSPDALKAWLLARELQRRASFDSADAAIDRAVALDSNFVLALLDAVTIKSQAQFVRGQQYGPALRVLAERAARLTDSTTDRTRWRTQAMLASINTDGPTAVSALNRLLAADSTDYEASTLLAYVNAAYGWQYGATTRDIVAAQEHLVRLDSTNASVLARRLYLAMALDDSADIQHQLARIRRGDTTSGLLDAMLRSVDALAASDRHFDDLVPRLAALPAPQWIMVFRNLRSYRPDRADRLIEATRGLHSPVAPIATGAAVQMAAAEGRWHAVDSLRRTGAFAAIPGLDRIANRAMVAGAIAGAGDEALAANAAASLANGHPPDSALAQFNRAAIWLDGWLIAAHAAMYGDTSLARRWQLAFGTLPTKGASPRAYTTAIRADIGARMAARRGELGAALAQARRALAAWDIHSDNSQEFSPEPAMRFHLAELLRATGKADSAAVLFRSLMLPTTWVGFYTAGSALELGEMLEHSRDRAAARANYLTALRLWERGDVSVNDLRERARRGIARLDRAR